MIGDLNERSADGCQKLGRTVRFLVKISPNWGQALGEEAKIFMELSRKNASAKPVELDARADVINKLMKLDALNPMQKTSCVDAGF